MATPSLYLQDKYFQDVDDDDDDDFYVIGDRVFVDGNRTGSVAYFGELDDQRIASGDWVGVVLDEPTGNHDGKLHGYRYFQCAPRHGIFVRPNRVQRTQDSALGSSAASSRTQTPIGHQSKYSAGSNRNTPASSSASYYYDDDYRMPTIESLQEKLRNLKNKTGVTAEWLTTTPHRSKSHSDLSSISQRFENLQEEQLNYRDHFRPHRQPLSDVRQSGQQCVTFDSRSGPLKKGDRVKVNSGKGTLSGILRYIGETHFATGEWAGVELDTPEGRNDGSVLDQRYFYCPKDYGLFVPLIRVTKIKPGETSDFTGVRSTILSPPPTTRLGGGYSDSAASRTSSSMSYESPIYDHHGHCRPPSYTGSRYIGLDRPKFSDADIESSLKDSMRSRSPFQPLFNGSSYDNCDNYVQPYRYTSTSYLAPRTAGGRAVKYTFTSSKYDGNPIAHRTVVKE